MSQFPSASLHRVDPGSRPDIAERNSQGRSGRAPGMVDFGALLDRMAPRSPDPAEAPDRVEGPAATGRAAPDREVRRTRELLSTARNERHQPAHEARTPRRDDEAEAGETSAPSLDVSDTASMDARAPGDESTAPRPPRDVATPDASDVQAPGKDDDATRAEMATTSGPDASDVSRDEAIEQAALGPEHQAEPARATPAIDIATTPAAVTLLALGLPAQQAQIAPVAPTLPAADLLAGGAAIGEPIAPNASIPAAMAAATPVAPLANGQSVGSASDPAFGTMLQAQAATQPREVQAAPQQPRFPETAPSAPAAEVTPAARAAVSTAPVLAQAVATQSMDAGAAVTATQTGPAAAAAASPTAATPQAQVAVATPTLAAATSQERAGAPSTTVDPAQQFAIELEAPQAEGTQQAQPSASTPAAARPQQGAPAPVAAQLVAQGQAVDATAQAQAPTSTGQGATPLAKANADAPALSVAEATASNARKDAPEAAQAAQLPVQAARAEATPEAVAARGARVPTHPAVAQVAVSVAKAAQDGVERITIKLQPPELGRIDVKIEVGVDGRIQAVFAAERAATVDILQREVRELERALQGAGLDAGGGLSFGLKQNGGNGGHGAYAGLERGQGGPGRGAPEEDARQQQQPRRMATADGRVDIHV